MPSLQRYSSHGRTYWRIVESFRRSDGKPTVRVLMHLGNAEQLLARLQQGRAALRLRSVSAGAVDAAIALAAELNCAPIINEEVAAAGGQGRRRDGLSVGESLLAKVLATEPIRLGAIAYDTTNFFTYLDSRNARSQLAQRGHSKQRRHDLRQLGLAYVTALKPSHHRPWLAEDSRRLEAITLSSGEQVWACRSRRLVHGVEHTVVTVFSPRLYEGQRRGLQQQLRAALRQLGRISPHPRGGMAGARRQVERICGRQYLREVLRCEVRQEGHAVVIRPCAASARPWAPSATETLVYTALLVSNVESSMGDEVQLQVANLAAVPFVGHLQRDLLQQ